MRAAAGPREIGHNAPNASKTDPVSAAKARGRAARAAASGGGQGQLALNFEGLGITSADRTMLASAVQTTRAIIAEHS